MQRLIAVTGGETFSSGLSEMVEGQKLSYEVKTKERSGKFTAVNLQKALPLKILGVVWRYCNGNPSEISRTSFRFFM